MKGNRLIIERRLAPKELLMRLFVLLEVLEVVVVTSIKILGRLHLSVVVAASLPVGFGEELLLRLSLAVG